jgi:hypothetical protein
MRKRTLTFLFALSAAAAAAAAQGVDENLVARLVQKYKPEARRFDFGLIGDHPYAAYGIAAWPALMNNINNSRLEFVTHNGDFKNGSSVCSNEVFEDRLQRFNASAHPFIFTPGDNDWTDCHRLNNGPFDPLERLARIRQMFFADNMSQGRRKMEVVRQSEDPRFTLYRENAIWAMGNVVFATVHVVGSNNNWGRTAEQDREYTARNLANLYWIRTAFALARDGGFGGVVMIMQADMNWELPANDFERLGFNDTITVLAQEVQAFKKPVLLTHGDTHQLKMDKPLAGLRSRRRLENFTRLQVFSDLDSHWIKIRVEPESPSLFIVEQMIVPENVFNHDAVR